MAESMRVRHPATSEPARRGSGGTARRWAPVSLAVLAVALAPLAATSAFGLAGLGVLTALTAASLGPWRPARAVSLALVPSVAYAGGVASAITPSLLVVAGSAAVVGMVLPQGRRWLLVAVTLAITAVLVVAMRVMQSGPWGPEVRALPSLGTGLALAAAAAGAVLSWRELAWGSRLDRAPSALALVALVVALVRGLVGSEVPRSPAWYRERQALEHARAEGSRTGLLAALERLDSAGAADAALVRVALAVRANADPATVRALCPRGRRWLLDASWAAEIDLGQRACALVGDRPARAAGPDSGADGAALRRLGADQLADAGHWGRALDAYRGAADAGDSFAARDAVLGLLLAGRLDQARQLAPAPDPTYSLWLGGDVPPGDAWRAWNRLLDLDGLEPPSRRGLRLVDGPGGLVRMYDRDLGREVVVSRPRSGLDLALALPPTPAGALPHRLDFWIRGDGPLRIDVVGAGHTTASVGCGLDGMRPPSAAVCAGRWDEVAVPLDGVRPPVSAILVRGSFRLARVVAAP